MSFFPEAESPTVHRETLRSVPQSAVIVCVMAFTLVWSATTGWCGEVTARLSIGPIEVSLIDLAPDDGIDPSFRWTQNSWTTEIEREAYFFVRGRAGVAPTPLSDPLRTSLAGDLIGAVPGEPSYATIFGDAGGMDLYLEIEPTDTAEEGYADASFNLDPSRRFFTPSQSGTGMANYFGSDYTFEVSPQTAVIFSTTATGTVRNTTPNLLAHQSSVYAAMHAGELMTEEPEGYIDPFGNDWYPHVHDGSGVRGSATVNFAVGNLISLVEGLAENSRTRTLTRRFDNASDDLGLGYFYLNAVASVRTAAVVVPEPSALAIGLFAITGALTMRRRR
jgi:hypothetical protein